MTRSLTNPLFSAFNLSFSIRELVLMAGGLFLLAKSTSEIHSKMELIHEKDKKIANDAVVKVIFQITMLDIVFSFDSILTAVGLTTHLPLMIIAVVAAMFIMVFFAAAISKFISDHPTLEILALSFLILIGFMLVLEGVHIEVPKAYIYFAVFFSLMVEMINMRIQKKHNPVHLNRDPDADKIDKVI
jgi:predicted tellurium resistance membrane protein TerC